MLTHLSEQLRLPDGRRVRAAGRGDRRPPAGAPRGRLPHGVQPRRRPPPVALRHRRDRAREAGRARPPPEHRPRHVPARGRRRRRPLQLRPSMHFRRYEAAVNAELARYYALAADDRYDIVGRLGVPAAAAAPPRPRHAPSRTAPGRSPTSSTAPSRAGATTPEATCGAPGTSRSGCSRGRKRPWWRRPSPWEAIDAHPPGEVEAAERARRSWLLAMRRRRCATTCPNSSWPPTSSSSSPSAGTAAAGRRGPRPVIAGYHWFTDWGRDTMIALEGLCLLTGRHREAGSILRMFAHHVRDGLIPNLFPDGDTEGLYHTADAKPVVLPRRRPLRAPHRRPGDAAALLPVLAEIVRAPPGRDPLRDRRRSGGRPPAGRGAPASSSPGWTPRCDDWVVTPAGESRSRSTRSGTRRCASSTSGR